ncbi:MAG: transposase, partial [Endozoicomonadaceae bacterium]|nr:transposase [Endozoicomonadaceae bacterium]
RGGNTTKIHMLADGNGRPIDFEITGGEVHDSKMAYSLMLKIKEADYFIADKGYDSELIREQAKQLGMEAMILKRSNTKQPAIHFKKKYL